MSDIRVGIIGAGRFGSLHAKNMTKTGRAKVTVVADSDLAKAKELANKYDAKAVAEYSELLDSPDVDAAIVVVPHKFLADIAIATAKAGKHVLCQKPMGLNVAEGEAVVEAAKRSNVTLMVYGQNRYKTIYKSMRQIIEKGGIGEIYLTEDIRRFRGFGPGYPAWFKSVDLTGGGVLQNFTCHSLDVLRFVLQREISSVYAILGRFVFHDIEGEDNAVMSLRFDDGSLATCVQSWSSSGSRLDVTGTKGRIYTDGEAVFHDTGNGFSEVARTPEGEDERYLLEQHFLACLLDGKEPAPSGAEYIGVIKAIQAAYLSSEKRCEIDTADIR